jgi:hypothetical protein
VESAIKNAIWTCFLIHGVPMRRSIFSYQWQSACSKMSKCVIDLNDPTNILEAEYNEPVPAKATE